MKLRLLLRVIEMLGAAIVFGFGLWMWLHVILADAAHGARLIDRATLIVFMMWVAPVIVLMVGSYLQSIHRKGWSAILVLIGGVSALPFIALHAWFTFAYT